MFPLKIFVDSDVVLSSLISEKGAAHFLLSLKSSQIKFYISNFSVEEQRTAVKKLKIDQKKLQRLIKRRIIVVQLKQPLKQIKKKYQAYAFDPDDTHIVAGAEKSKAKFLITYNQKHFRKEKIKKGLGVIIFTPAQFLQYLRSQSLF